jgi:hypothetical protein
VKLFTGSRGGFRFAALGLWHGRSRMWLDTQAKANGIEHAQHSAELGMPVLAERFVKALAP